MNTFFESLIRIIWSNISSDIKVNTIVTDQEKALINITKNYFPISIKINCIFHYE